MQNESNLSNNKNESQTENISIDNKSIDKDSDISINIKEELNKLKKETLKELKEILTEIEKTA